MTLNYQMYLSHLIKFKKFDVPNFISIDTEGSELNILKGKSLLKRVNTFLSMKIDFENAKNAIFKGSF